LTAKVAQSVLDFWFANTNKKHWFNSTVEFDQLIKSKFESTWESAAKRELDDWRKDPESALALIIVLDQFPLNMFRGDKKSFSTEAYAIEVAHHSINNKFDKRVDIEKLSFLYLPLMHSENIEDQNLSVSLFKHAGLEDNLRFAKHHRDIVKQFGRFPHRNAILKRVSNSDEIEYLNSPHAFKG